MQIHKLGQHYNTASKAIIDLQLNVPTNTEWAFYRKQRNNKGNTKKSKY